HARIEAARKLRGSCAPAPAISRLCGMESRPHARDARRHGHGAHGCALAADTSRRRSARRLAACAVAARRCLTVTASVLRVAFGNSDFLGHAPLIDSALDGAAAMRT